MNNKIKQDKKTRHQIWLRLSEHSLDGIKLSFHLHMLITESEDRERFMSKESTLQSYYSDAMWTEIYSTKHCREFSRWYNQHQWTWTSTLGSISNHRDHVSSLFSN